MSDAHKRTITKALIYRGGSVFVLGILSWVTTEDLIQTSAITIGYQVTSIIIYYIYERIWGHIRWGR